MSATNSTVSNRLKGKIAIVTAATSGVGLATARRLAQDGAIIVISDANVGKLDTAVETLKNEGHDVIGVVCRLDKKEDRTKLIDKAIGINEKIDIFVSNANIFPAKNQVLDNSEDEWNHVFGINVRSVFLFTWEIVPHMTKGGSIVYITSIAGVAIYEPITMYSITQTGLISLGRAMTYPCSQLGIRVNCVSQGASQSDIPKIVRNDQLTITKILKRIPLKRFSDPRDAASLVAFLCSDEASYIAGENLVVAGGLHSRL